MLFVNNDYVFNFKSNNKAAKKRNQNIKMNLLFFQGQFYTLARDLWKIMTLY